MKGKRCSKCGEWKPYTEFYKNSTYTDGYAGKCKECKKDYQQKWRENNREEHRAYSREYYQDHKEERLGYYKEWREENPEKKRASDKRWRREHPERMRAMRKVQNARRRALEMEAEGDYTPEEWLSLKQRYGDRCLKCGAHESEVKITPDHIVPLFQGGANSIDNIQPLCWSCNAAKGAEVADYRPHAERDDENKSSGTSRGAAGDMGRSFAVQGRGGRA